MQKNWFPLVEADIFISHSHQDEELALTLAGWLSSTFELNAFIDSSVWGNANDLLKMIDKQYCLKNGEELYDYNKRNESTSHVHMMLSTALSMMIDKAECAWVLNTANSITSKEAVSRTKSPWIFSEIAMMQLIRRKESIRQRTKTAALAKADIEERSLNLNISHLVKLTSFPKINNQTLLAWEDSSEEGHPLDRLLRFSPPA